MSAGAGGGDRVALPVLGAVVETSDEPDFPDEGPATHTVLANVVLLRPTGAARASLADAGALRLRKGETVLLESDRGSALAVVAAPSRRQLVEPAPMPRVLRRATDTDLKAETRARIRDADALRLAGEAVRALNLPAKALRADVSRNGQRVVVHLSSEERIDLRVLGRQLNDALHARVEIRHVGLRDAAKAVGGVGACGLQLCCNTFLADFAPVSIRHAKDQGLALKPERVSGACGRLMCCLVYEEAFYRAQRALFPKVGKHVVTPKGAGRVRDVDVLARTARVALDGGGLETCPVDALQAASPAGPQAGGDGTPG